MSEKRWFAVLVKPVSRSEEKIAEELRNREFPTFVPLRWQDRPRKGRIERTRVPLFPRYLFVRFDREIFGWQKARYTRGVSEIIGTHVRGTNELRPSPVPKGVIEGLIQRQAEEGGAVHLLEPEKVHFNRGDNVRVAMGEHFGLDALVVADEEARVRIMLDMLGKPHVIPVPRESLTLVKSGAAPPVSTADAIPKS